MAVKAGDTIVIESKKVAQTGRTGVIEEVLQENPPRYLVRWADDRTTIFAPSAGVATIESKRRKRKAA